MLFHKSSLLFPISTFAATLTFQYFLILPFEVLLHHNFLRLFDTDHSANQLLD